ncbi:helix-turn-helix domain-containing protein [Bdellovibrio sp. NC01]|uniref:helix-turn-helix domain-containing protein n=1 Tax=Bdellovibrio sp. NC01 TaxID=2220073 RepID=UPI00115B472F|nr:hypothetical protein [Bdellovibrio sp. NC01]QDK37199.1 hypothetical protein DOE51_06150 [Bdellovibrio sp. NC01]
MKKLKLHETIPALLKKRGMTLRALAKASKVPPSNISGWAVPGAKPKDILQVAAVAEALEVSLNFLLFGKPEKKIDLDELPSEVVVSGVYRLRLERIIQHKNQDEDED